MKKQISLEKVAERAGVAKSTVSFVLNNKNNVAPQTRERVLAALKELGYSKTEPVTASNPLPNREAPAPSYGQTPVREKPSKNEIKNILIYVNPDLRDDEVVGTYMSGLREFADIEDRVSFTFAMSSSEVESSLQLQFLEQATQPHGILMMGINSSHPFVNLALQTGKPCLIVNRINDHPLMSYVSVNHFLAGQDAARYLLGLGHRHFVMILENYNNESEISRLEGVLAQLAHQSFEAEVALVKRIKPRAWPENYRAASLLELLRDEKILFNLNTEIQIPAGLKILRHLDELPAGFNPTCLVAANDRLTSAAQAGLLEAGLNIPEDVSVMSLNNSSLSLKATPPITAIDEGWHDQGYLAGWTLTGLIDRKNIRCQKIQIRHHLIERGSTAPPKSTN